jgi:hypothetical protein
VALPSTWLLRRDPFAPDAMTTRQSMYRLKLQGTAPS